MKKLLLRSYGIAMIVLPIILWVLLLTRPDFDWDRVKITILALITGLGIAGGILILYIPKFNREIEKENAGGYTQSFRNHINRKLN